MNDIDFLPSDYVCVKTTRTNNNWLRGLFVMVLGLMAVGWVAQQKALSELRARRTRAQDNATAMLASVNAGDQLRADLQRAENVVRIQDGLRTQVPPTRWLSAIVDALPQRVSLVEIQAAVEVEAEHAEKTTSSSNPAQTETAPSDPIQRDLDRLANVTPRRTVVIAIRGSAHNDLEVSQLLTALHRIDMFDQVQLLFTDQLGQDSLRSFAIRLRTRPLGGRTQRNTQNQPVATVSRELK